MWLLVRAYLLLMLKTPVKLTYVINNLNVGGAEKLLLSTVKKLDQNKYDITVCPMLKSNTLLNDFLQAGVRVFSINMTNKKDIRGFFKLYGFFKSNKIDIVHTHLSEADVFGRFAAIMAKVPIIISTDHRVDDWKMKPKRLRTKLRFLLNRLAAKFSNGIITVSNDIKDHLIKNEKIPPEKIYVIKNGIEINQKHTSKNVETDKKEIVLGCAARLSREKGHSYLLRAFKTAKTKIPNLKLLLAGEGIMRVPLEKLAQELEISHDVRFLGLIDDMNNFFTRIDIFILPSLQEGIPLALLEAMAAEKPIIATAVGGIPEVIDNGSDGILISAADEHELKSAIISAIQNEERRKEMAHNARNKIIENFSLAKTINQLETLYYRLQENSNMQDRQSGMLTN